MSARSIRLRSSILRLHSRNKNDRVDARVIAHYAQKMKPAQTLPPSPVQKRLRQLQGDRRLVVNCLRQVKNRRQTQPDSEALARLQATHEAEGP